MKTMESTNTTGRPGRPRRSPENLRRHPLRVAVSAVELEAIRARAETRGQRLAVYIRRCALIGSPHAQELLDLLSRLLAQLRGVAANLNQASHRANRILATQPDPGAVETEQQQIVAALAEVRRLMADIRVTVSELTKGPRP